MRVWPALVYVAQVVGLAVAYFITAKLGVFLALLEASVLSVLWPAAGLALAALFLVGLRLWPGVAAGALSAAVVADVPVAVAVAVAVGSTLKAVIGAVLLKQTDMKPSLERIGDVLLFALFGAAASSILSATIGVAGSCLGQGGACAEVGTLWGVWWLGDAVGTLLFAPAILVWAVPSPSQTRPSTGEVAVLSATMVICAALSFGDVMPVSVERAPLAFFVFPPLIWAALRTGQRGVVLGLVLVTAVAAWGTTNGHGPFARSRDLDNLVLLQFFNAVVVVTTLLLAAAIIERDRKERELHSAKLAAERANHAKDRFLAATRHDLAQPLLSAQLFLNVLGTRQLDAEAQEMVTSARGALDTLGGTLEALHEISEIDAVVPEIKSFAIAPLLRQLGAEYRLQAAQHDLGFRLVSSSVRVRTDPQLLARILHNLLSNAVRYTPQGRILLGCRRRGECLRIEVRDTGRGVPADKLSVIFEEFQQIGRPEANRSRGLGLGLAIVERIARLLGVKVEVASTPGKGSVFAVLVPLAPGSAAREAAPRAMAES